MITAAASLSLSDSRKSPLSLCTCALRTTCAFGAAESASGYSCVGSGAVRASGARAVAGRSVACASLRTPHGRTA